MKKALIALAVLGLTGGAAVAQSSVTLFGVVDADLKYTKANGQTRKSLDTSGLGTSRIGLRAVEDLGGGLKAGFWMESELFADTGAVDATRFWGRRATVNLTGNFGEIRLGRNKTASRLHIEEFDPYAFTGLGSTGVLYSNLGSGNSTAFGRADNLASYSLPSNLGGFYGGVDVSAPEGTVTNKHQSVRVGYKAGALHVSGALANAYGANNKYKLASAAGAYDFGVVRPSLTFTQAKYGARKQTVWTGAVTVPLGQGQLIGSYTDSKANGAAETAAAGYTPIGDAKLFAAGYVYNLSKRTALYTTVAQIRNSGPGRLALGGSPIPGAGGKSSGADVGVRHSF